MYVSSQKCQMYECVQQAGASDRSCICAGHRCMCNFILDLSGSVLKWQSPKDLSSTVIAHGANIRYQNLDLRSSVNRRYPIPQGGLRQIFYIFYILILRLYFNLNITVHLLTVLWYWCAYGFHLLKVYWQFWCMYCISCTVYHPDQHMHSIYIYIYMCVCVNNIYIL